MIEEYQKQVKEISEGLQELAMAEAETSGQKTLTQDYLEKASAHAAMCVNFLGKLQEL